MTPWWQTADDLRPTATSDQALFEGLSPCRMAGEAGVDIDALLDGSRPPLLLLLPRGRLGRARNLARWRRRRRVGTRWCWPTLGDLVAQRLVMDHPERAGPRCCWTWGRAWRCTSKPTRASATAHGYWFFLRQPAPLPERLIEADPVSFVRAMIGRRSAGWTPFTAAALAAYERAAMLPGDAHGICEDGHAAAGIDLIHDRADREACRHRIRLRGAHCFASGLPRHGCHASNPDRACIEGHPTRPQSPCGVDSA